MADCIIAGGVESMSVMAMGGWRIVPNPKVGKENPTWYWGMGLTAEAVAEQYKVSREEQDQFSLKSHEKAIAAIKEGRFKDQIAPVSVEHIFLDENEKRQVKNYIVDTDEGAGRREEGCECNNQRKKRLLCGGGNNGCLP